jgi:predicted helicase
MLSRNKLINYHDNIQQLINNPNYHSIINIIYNDYSHYDSIKQVDEYFINNKKDISMYQNIIRPFIELLFNLNIIDYHLQDLCNDQKEKLKILYNHFKDNDRAILNLFCRYGKTKLSCIYSLYNFYKKILILVPSIYLVEQTCIEWSKYYNKENILQISCQNNYKSLINNFITKNNFIIICVYNSCSHIQHIHFDLGIFDEAHRTVKFDGLNYNQLLLTSNKITHKLFLTATVKEYNENVTYSMDNEEIYGPIIATVSAKQALEIGRLSKYKLLCILIKNNIPNNDLILECLNQDNNISRDDIIEYIKIGKTLSDAILKNNIKHTITYHTSIARCKMFNFIMKYFNFNSDYIEGNHNKDLRIQIINNFISNNNSILCSCKTLQEGVNIPECDAVCFVDVKTQIIDTIQSASRCLTKHDDKNMAYIILPFFGDSEMLKQDTRTNDLRLIIKNLIEIDENLKENFEYIKFNKFNSGTSVESSEIIIPEINVEFDILVVEQLQSISYDTYSQAIQQIKDKYTSIEEYRHNILVDFNNNIPRDPDIIYKRTGWKNWKLYLGLTDNLSEIKYLLRKCLKKYDLYGPVNIYEKLDDNIIGLLKELDVEINIYKLLNYNFHSWNTFEKFIMDNKIKDIFEYNNKFDIKNGFPFCPFEYYKEYGFNDTKWFKEKKKKMIF